MDSHENTPRKRSQRLAKVWFTLDGCSLTFGLRTEVDLLIDKDLTGDTSSLFYSCRQKPPSAQQ